MFDFVQTHWQGNRDDHLLQVDGIGQHSIVRPHKELHTCVSPLLEVTFDMDRPVTRLGRRH